jgi:hypothetical protein
LVVGLDPDLEALLSQLAADVDLSPEVLARIMLESALIGSVTR